MDAALLIARLIIGLGLAAHGMQKLLGWFSGYGLKGTAGFFESIGFRPGVLFALAAGLGEVAGGLLTAAGPFGPVGPRLIIPLLGVGILAGHPPNGVFSQTDGDQVGLLFAVLGFVLAILGPGVDSLHRVLRP